MPKLFVVSDIHSFYTPLKKALDDTGFDPTNEDHWLVVCGDVFDRGDESKEILKFLMSLERKVLIRGNHEDLLQDCIARGYPCSHDHSNGTVKTIRALGGEDEGHSFDKCCDFTWMRTEAYRSELVDYFETSNYIFVHGWIPCEKYISDPSEPWIKSRRTFEYNPNWRDCNDAEWDSARWLNGMDKALDGIIEPGKTIVCGHWHCSYGHSLDVIKNGFRSEFGDDAIWEPWYHEGCIAIDRCTAHTGEVNVLVLEDDFI